MKQKTLYEAPTLDLFSLLDADIITASGAGGNDIGEDSGENDGEWMSANYDGYEW